MQAKNSYTEKKGKYFVSKEKTVMATLLSS